MRSVLVFLGLLTASPALAGPQCTSEPKDKWMAQQELKEKLASAGYKIDVFKITPGNCYELYGRDQAGKRVEVYFDPTNGNTVKQFAR